jgi:hypothetical protein
MINRICRGNFYTCAESLADYEITNEEW